MSSERIPPEKDIDPPASRAAERLAVIVDAAERAALSVIDDAEEEARRYLAEAQARADKIVAARLREEADRLDPPEDGEKERRLRPVETEEAEEPDPYGGEPEGEGAAGAPAARLLATQMAVSGSSRREIEMRLRAGFDIDDAGEILDAILGPEG
jgi:hypothetical protein